MLLVFISIELVNIIVSTRSDMKHITITFIFTVFNYLNLVWYHLWGQTQHLSSCAQQYLSFTIYFWVCKVNYAHKSNISTYMHIYSEYKDTISLQEYDSFTYNTFAEVWYRPWTSTHSYSSLHIQQIWKNLCSPLCALLITQPTTW